MPYKSLLGQALGRVDVFVALSLEKGMDRSGWPGVDVFVAESSILDLLREIKMTQRPKLFHL